MAERQPNTDERMGRALGAKPRIIKHVRSQLSRAGLVSQTPKGRPPLVTPESAAAHLIPVGIPNGGYNNAAETVEFVGQYRDAAGNALWDALAGLLAEMQTRHVDVEVEFVVAGEEDLAVRIERGGYSSEETETTTFTPGGEPFTPVADVMRSTLFGSRALQTLAGLISPQNERSPGVGAPGPRIEPSGRPKADLRGSHRTREDNARCNIGQADAARGRPPGDTLRGRICEPAETG